MDEMVSAWLPLFVRVKVAGALAVPTGTLLKFVLDGVSEGVFIAVDPARYSCTPEFVVPEV